MDFFDFKHLPVELNNIINNNVKGMYEYEWKEAHKQLFTPSLDLIKGLTRTYSNDNEGMGYVIYDDKHTQEEQEVLFKDNGLVFTFPIEDWESFDYWLHLNEDLYFINESEEDLTDSEENLDMEDNFYDINNDAMEVYDSDGDVDM